MAYGLKACRCHPLSTLSFFSFVFCFVFVFVYLFVCLFLLLVLFLLMFLFRIQISNLFSLLPNHLNILGTLDPWKAMTPDYTYSAPQSKSAVCAQFSIFQYSELWSISFAHTAFLPCQTIMLYLHVFLNKQRVLMFINYNSHQNIFQMTLIFSPCS